jgi:predicted dehydrogenase
MFRVGIIGSDNSHALAFAKLVNIKNEETGEFRFPDVKITAIYGVDREHTENVAKEGLIETVVDKPEDLMGMVDAVMVVFRHGDLHAPHALPFIKAGIPTWIDKPFTVKISDAKEIIEEADKKGTLVTGGSTCKYLDDVLYLKDVVENQKETGKISSAIVNYPGDPDSEYAGLHFYGPHLAEIVMTIFGYDVKSVVASVCDGNVIAIAKYDRYQVVMNFAKKTKGHKAVIYGEDAIITRDLIGRDGYLKGFTEFVNMLRSGQRPFPLENLLAPTVLINAIEKALETGREVCLSELE